MLKKIFSAARTTGLSLAMSLVFAGVVSASVGANLSVAPNAANTDNLIGATGASWKFSVTTTGALATGDVIRFVFPQVNGQPFSISVPTSSVSGPMTLYSSIVSSTVGVGKVMMPSGQPAIYGFVTSSAVTSSSIFTLGGINNGATQLAMAQNLSWLVEAGTLADINHPEGGFITGTAKFSATNLESLVRAGGSLVSDNNSGISPSSYTAGATNVTYTFTIKATSSIPAGGKIVVNLPLDYSLVGVTVNLGQQISNTTNTALGSFSTTTSGMTNRVTLVTSNTSTAPGDVITVQIGGLTNPVTAGVYRPFSIFTAKANGGLLDGSFMGFENTDFNNGAPPPNDTVHIGGNNFVTVNVYKQTGTTTALLSGNELTQVKVGIGCPDKMFFVGEKWLNASSSVTYNNLLDCNYIVMAQPFSSTSTSFFESFLPPAMKSVNAIGGQRVTSSLVFGVPDAVVAFVVKGGVSGQQAFINAYTPNFQSFVPVFTDNTYATPGFSATGTGYVRLRVKSGDTWSFNLQSGMMGSAGNFSSGTVKYWPPSIPSSYISSAGTTTLSDANYVQANNTLNVVLSKVGGGSVTNACVGVKRTGGNMFMGAQDTVCQANNGSNYQFKVPSGTIAVQLMQPGSPPTDYTVGINSLVSTTTISLSAPSTYISVLVQDGSNRPISGAPIFTQGGSGGFSQGLTGSGGTTTLYVAPGTYSVGGFAPSFGPLTNQTVTLSGASSSVKFTVDSSNFKSISGRVTNGANGVSGVQIGAWGVSGTTGGNGTQTDANGNYLLYVPAGIYNVGGWSDSTGGLPPQQVNVSSGNQTGINFVLAGLGTLHLEIQNASNVGQLFAGAFSTSTGRGNGTNSWSASGTSKVANIKLAAGAYTLRVGSPMIGEITSDSVTITDGVTVGKTYNINASTTLYTVSGTVTTSAGGLANVEVWASKIGGAGFFSTLTDSNGAYSLSMPNSSTYHLGVKSTGYTSISGEVNVTVAGGNVTQNFSMTSAGSTITGTITGTGAAAVNNAWVSAKKTVNGNDVWTGAQTDASGAYSVSVDSGAWTVYAEGPCYQRTSGVSATAGSSGNNITLTAVSGCTIPTTAVSGITPASGGQVANNGVTLDIPAAALGSGQSTVSVSVATSSVVVSTNAATPLKNSAQDISITNGTTKVDLSSNINISLSYDPNELPHGVNEKSLQLAYFDSGTWEPVESTVDTVNHKISASVSHFSEYANILSGVPDKPTGFTATAASVSQINLSWTAPTNASSSYYIIYRSLTDSNWASAVSIATTTATSYSNTGLSASTKYYYKVAGYNANGEGLNSDSANATTNAAAVVSTDTGGGSIVNPAPLDTTPPYNTSVSINSGAQVTTSTVVTLILVATDVSQMAISNQADLRDAPWETYTYSKNWTLTPGYGVKTVYVRYRDLAGNMAAVVSDTITYAATATAEQVAPSTSTVSTVAQSPTTFAKAGVAAVQRFKFVANLKLGVVGTAVKELQTLLKDLGYFTYPKLTNYFGLVTKSALLKYQKTKNLAATSILDEATRASLNAESNNQVVKATEKSPAVVTAIFVHNLQPGSRGEEVRLLQQKLRELGYFKFSINTGLFGPATRAAVVAFQKAKGLKPYPGWVGPATRAALNSL